jgi:transcriptional regulator with XRE-family HTH domain
VGGADRIDMGFRITLGALRLGKELRALRESTDVTVDQAAEAIYKSEATVSRFETGRSVIRRLELITLLDLYGVTTAERRAYTLADEARKTRSWWSTYSDVLPAKFDTWLSLEPDASTIRHYSSLNVPGILQNEAFARARLLSDVRDAVHHDDLRRRTNALDRLSRGRSRQRIS